MTWATSPTETATPFERLTGILAMSAAVRPRAATRTSASVLPRSAVPAGTSTFSRCSALTTSASEMWYASSRSRSTTTWISRVDSPTRATEPTPRTFSSRRLITLSAKVVAACGERPGASRPIERTGICPKSIRWTIGSSISRGRSPRMAAILPRTSWEALMAETSSWNSTTMLERPSCEIDSMCFTPSTVLISSSIFFVTSRSTVSGPAPG